MIHQKNIKTEWIEENLTPFNELILSWNATRPTKGSYLFYISAKIKEWSPWLLYASWGADGQKSFLKKAENAPVRVYQDALEVTDENQATGFQVKVLTEGNASLTQVRHLHVYTNSNAKEPAEKMEYSSFVRLDVPGISQMALPYERNKDLCSASATTAVLRYLTNNPQLDPIDFAQKSWDGGFDIFGNWVFSVAQAATELGETSTVWVERLNGFDPIYRRLHQGLPVVVSVRGPLPGGALPYAKGHLIAVTGYDPAQKKVLCMDPAFSSNTQTHVLYDLSDFMAAWNRRDRVAYIFNRELA